MALKVMFTHHWRVVLCKDRVKKVIEHVRFFRLQEAKARLVLALRDDLMSFKYCLYLLPSINFASFHIVL